MLSHSVGRIPDADQEDIKVCSRRAFWRSFNDAFAVRLSRDEVAAPNPTLFVAGEAEKAVRESNAALAALMARATARYVPGLGHGWLGTRLELHVATVDAWLSGRDLPQGLLVETKGWSRPGVERLLASQAQVSDG